jgi:aspartate racemase
MNGSLGVLGGMGPLASAEFMKTIYELNNADTEQQMPICVLYSDPTIPDRTEAIIGNSSEILASRLVEALDRLCLFNVKKIVIPCVTAHCFLHSIPPHIRNRVVSLVDIIMDEILTRKGEYLLVCSQGTYTANIFQHHPLWRQAKRHILMPDQGDRNVIHNLIYDIKKGTNSDRTVSIFDTLLSKYQTKAFIAGCTEVHLLVKYLTKRERHETYQVIDPLMIVASDIRRIIDE